jgi:hypothetical protein
MRSMAEDEAIGELAAEAAAGTDYRPQLRMLLEWMEVCGLVSREAGRVTKRNAPSAESDPSPAEKTTNIESDPTPSASPSKSALFTTFSQPTEGVVRFNVSVKVDMAEFAGWKPDRIAAFFGGIAQVLAAKGMLEKDASES